MTTPEIFGHLPDGRSVHRLTLQGPKLRLCLLTLGAIVQDLRLAGVAHPLVLGYAQPEAYLSHGLFVGAIIGRYANRIGGAQFSLDGKSHDVDANFLGRHCLHGGRDGPHQQLWQIAQTGTDFAVLQLHLPDGHMGFPGNLQITARFSVAQDALDIQLTAQSDAATPCSLTHHGYFNLDGSADVLAHDLQLFAQHYLPVDNELIPTGEITEVADGPYDFRQNRRFLAGYDHGFCLTPRPQGLTPVARLTGASGLVMEVESNAPGVQLYDGRHFSGERGLEGRAYLAHAGLALETQHWPDAPNKAHFPDAILQPGAIYRNHTVYRFTAPAGAAVPS